MGNDSSRNYDNPKLLKRKLSNGRTNFYLEYYLGYNKVFDEETGQEKIKHIRKHETLPIYLIGNPRTEADRIHNKEALGNPQALDYYADLPELQED